MKKKKDYKQQDIAKALGVTKGAVSHWFHGRTTPSLNHAIKMKRMFDIPVERWGKQKA